MPRGPNLRKCSACGAYVVAQHAGDLRRFNCVTGNLANGVSVPDQCWQRRFPKFGPSVLAAMSPLHVNNHEQNVSLQRTAATAEALAVLAEAGRLDTEAVTELMRKHTLFRVRRLREKLPHDVPFLATIDDAIRLGGWRKKYKRPSRAKPKPPKPPQPPKPPAPQPTALSPDFARAMILWENATRERAKRKSEAGHPYHPQILQRRLTDARRFLEFLQADGVTSWSNVAQRHLDAFVVEVNYGAAKRAYTFLRHIRNRFRFTAKLQRPKRRRPDMLKHIATETELARALENARNMGSATTCWCCLHSVTRCASPRWSIFGWPTST